MLHPISDMKGIKRYLSITDRGRLFARIKRTSGRRSNDASFNYDALSKIDRFSDVVARIDTRPVAKKESIIGVADIMV